ncbi:VOC family protein [Pseudoroseicyclus aestuarii]|uniref:Catechol 2,3-dioxygenase-like lactoylglutathione lyase family enzyme n=1 Tax=Pseudoroseicyclus aestuarii TaxID=1795041 RepID=A0A318SWY9_9RHOB|nr:VOC family protein [Pseudoroseicyclus aestuarii]PYE85845.1 catechol 2,3-dioxygenase-like lactoylglutathione lyase family enzyme [Pseudoroseicyclus aestuarii]
MLLDLHHVQLAMPEGQEDVARAFYGGALGLPEVEKPAALQGRGGVWFETGALRLHLGVEAPFTPARKAHPAFRTGDLADAVRRLKAAGLVVRDGGALPGLVRVYVDDPFGNRIEILETR